MIERTLVLLKPDAVSRGLVGEITKRFEQSGLKIVGIKMAHIDSSHSRKHYDAHVSKKFYTALEKFITESPLIAMAVEGISAVALVRKLVGDTEPHKAAPGTIREDFARHSYDYSDKKGIAIKNLIHASSSASDAEKEIALWFKKDELFSYESVHDRHVL